MTAANLQPTNTSVVLARRPSGNPVPDDFALATEPLKEPRPGEVLLKNDFISLDAGFRNWLDEDSGDDVMPAMPLGAPVMGRVLGTVERSRHPDFKPGDRLTATLAWQEYSVTDATDLLIPLPDPLAAEPHHYLGVLGDTGLSAYFGIIDIAQPQWGETALISAAGGAEGSIAGQIARIQGARTVGIAGGETKCRQLEAGLGYDAMIDRHRDWKSQLQQICPDGVDVYFDNVGGPLLEAVLGHINEGARIVLCGAVASYGNRTPGPANLYQLVTRQATMKGFLTHTRVEEHSTAREQLARWLDDGRLRAPEYRLHGIGAVPQAFCDLFLGRNLGKTLVEL